MIDDGILIGLLLGEGSFTNCSSRPRIAIKMHVRHHKLLSSLHEKYGGKLYGPYLHQDRNYYTLNWASKKDILPLIQLLDSYDFESLCDHVGQRYRALKDLL